MGKAAVYGVTWNAAAACYQVNVQASEDMAVPRIKLGERTWSIWLEQVSSFAFHSKHGHHITVHHERRARGGTYWIAQRRVGGKLKKVYLGPSSQVTLCRLEQAAVDLAAVPLTGTAGVASSPSSSAQPAHGSLGQDRLAASLPVTKFFVPTPSRMLLPRPRLFTYLEKGMNYPLTLVSAPAGFGKTTLLAA